MRSLFFLLWLGLSLSVSAQEPGSTADPTEAAPTEADSPAPATLPADAALERHFPLVQQRRLGEGTDAFLALWLPAAQPQARGSILLVGDHGEHADWPELIGPARRQLSEAGWDTLAMALAAEPPPLFGLSEAALAERHAARKTSTLRRLELGLQSLRDGHDTGTPIAIIARGSASYWALTQANEDQQIAGLVLFQARTPAFADPGLQELATQWDRPLLELVPTTSQPLAAYRERALAAQRQGRPEYRQWKMEELRAGPQNQAILIRRLQGWLERLDGAGRD